MKTLPWGQGHWLTFCSTFVQVSGLGVGGTEIYFDRCINIDMSVDQDVSMMQE